MIIRRIIPCMIIALIANVVCGQDEGEISSDEMQIRAAVEGYLLAINSGDASAAADYWIESGRMVSADGSRLVGRAAIQEDLEEFLRDNAGRQVSVNDVSIRILTPTVAIEEGEATIVGSDGEAASSTYQAIHVKQEGLWKLESLRETEVVQPPSGHDHLKELAWIIGEWVDQDEDSSIESSCRWTSNGNFITRSFTVVVGDAIEVEGTQVIGWDPHRERIRSWVFDSAGGFGEGSWTRSGDNWTVKNKFQLPDGRQGRSTNTFSYVDENTFKWQSKNRVVGDERLPDVDAVAVQRVN